MPLPLFQEAVEKALGRPVYTHEYLEPEKLIAEYEAAKSAGGCQSKQAPEITL